MNANPELVVASASKPSASSTRAEPTSHGLGMMNVSPACRARKRSAFSSCVTGTACLLRVMGSVHLELLGEAHLGAVGGMLSDPDVLRFTRVPDPTPADFPRQWLATYEAGRRDGTREAFAALDGDGRFVGLGLAFGIDREGGEAELGYIVAPEARGRGLGTAILRALTDWAFAATGVQRIQLFVDVENPASLRVAERSGYVREGVMRSVHFKNGRRIDAVLLSRLPSDPRRRRDGSAARA